MITLSAYHFLTLFIDSHNICGWIQRQIPNGEKGRPVEIGRSTMAKNSSISDSIRIWNLAPNSVTETKTLYQAKRAIKEYVKGKKHTNLKEIMTKKASQLVP